MAIEISRVLPVKNCGYFHSCVAVYQRVFSLSQSCPFWSTLIYLYLSIYPEIQYPDGAGSAWVFMGPDRSSYKAIQINHLILCSDTQRRDPNPCSEHHPYQSISYYPLVMTVTYRTGSHGHRNFVSFPIKAGDFP